MTRELFEKAKFGDRFVTRGGQEALFLRLTENSEWQFADFYVKDWGQIRVNRENGKCLNGPDIENDIVGMMPSLPSDLDEAAIQAHIRLEEGEGLSFLNIFKAGAQWRDAQIPKLPDSIDEAAEEYSPFNLNFDERECYGQFYLRLKTDAFKAGAEWMTRRGETIEGEVVKDIKNNLVVIAKGFSGKDAVFGDKVIVQVIKK